ncbi:hypothetical protein [Streptomyces sp. NPDC050535]|uniref:hypothetical protein n=1 Tax=Streptomyces sp. NPDC050535 TaxID=3365626 RepID=UPI00379CEB5D
MAEEDVRGGPGDGQSRRRDVIAGVITCAALAAAVVHAVAPGIAVDGVTALLLAVAVVPWLGDLFDSIELPGGAKFQYKQLVNRIEATEEATARAGGAADDASRAARIALVATGGTELEETPDGEAKAAVERLAADYTWVREHEESGPARTDRMERIFADLVALSPRMGDFDVAARLDSADPGTRLAAYARLYARPDGMFLDALTEAVLREEHAFSKYWGFHAIRAIVARSGAGRMRLEHLDALRACLSRLPGGSDRRAALVRLLAELDTSRTRAPG